MKGLESALWPLGVTNRKAPSSHSENDFIMLRRGGRISLDAKVSVTYDPYLPRLYSRSRRKAPSSASHFQTSRKSNTHFLNESKYIGANERGQNKALRY